MRGIKNWNWPTTRCSSSSKSMLAYLSTWCKRNKCSLHVATRSKTATSLVSHARTSDTSSSSCMRRRWKANRTDMELHTSLTTARSSWPVWLLREGSVSDTKLTGELCGRNVNSASNLWTKCSTWNKFFYKNFWFKGYFIFYETLEYSKWNKAIKVFESSLKKLTQRWRNKQFREVPWHFLNGRQITQIFLILSKEPYKR